MNYFIRKNVIGIIGLALMSTHIQAQNQPVIANSWTGFFGGVNIGGIFNDVELKANHLGFSNPDGVCNNNADYSSFFSGLQSGYSHQLNSRIVLGIEGDFTYNFTRSTKINCICPIDVAVYDKFSVNNRLQGSLRGRVGYALEKNLLPYFTAGGSWADLKMAYNNEGGDQYSQSTTSTGWLAGAGLEWGFSHDWSLRAEYYYIDYGNTINRNIPSVYGLYDANGGAHVNLNTNNIKVSLNYWF